MVPCILVLASARQITMDPMITFQHNCGSIIKALFTIASGVTKIESSALSKHLASLLLFLEIQLCKANTMKDKNTKGKGMDLNTSIYQGAF